MRTIVVFWTDPEDHDHGCNHGFHVYENNQGFLAWLNEIIKTRPKIKVQAFKGCIPIRLEAEEVTTRFRIIGG